MRSMALSIAQRVHGARRRRQRRRRALIADESSRLYDAMHGIIPRLTPLVLDNFGLADALSDLVERTRRSHAGVHDRPRSRPGDAPLAGDAALALYRAAQEGITNALRHGQARRASRWQLRAARRRRCALRARPTTAAACRPSGGATPRAAHYGLRWLAERVEGLGGGVRIEPALPRGVQPARCSVPLAAQRPQQAP